MEVKCLAQGPSAIPRQSRPEPGPLEPKSRRCPPCIIMEYAFTCRSTEVGQCYREHFVLSSSFTSHSKSLRQHRHLRGHAKHERHPHQSLMLKGEKQIFTSLFCNGARTRAAGVTGARSTSYKLHCPSDLPILELMTERGIMDS